MLAGTKVPCANFMIDSKEIKYLCMAGDLNDIADRLNLVRNDLIGIIDNYTFQFENISGQIYYLSSKNDEISGIIVSSSILPEVYYVQTINPNPPVEETPTGLYIDHNGETQLWTGQKYKKLSLEVVNSIQRPGKSDIIPTTKAVVDFVTTYKSDVDDNEVTFIQNGSISSYLSGLSQEQLNKTRGILIDSNANTSYYDPNVGEKMLSQKVVQEITAEYAIEEEVSGSITLPTTNAVYTYVNDSITGYVPSYIESVSSQIIESTPPEVYPISSFASYDAETIDKPWPSGIYVANDGETRFWNGEAWINIIVNAIAQIEPGSDGNFDYDAIPASALVTYTILSSYIADKIQGESASDYVVRHEQNLSGWFTRYTYDIATNKVSTGQIRNGWYRLYDSGWVEQGGYFIGLAPEKLQPVKLNLLVPMKDDKYQCFLTLAETKDSLTTTPEYGQATKMATSLTVDAQAITARDKFLSGFYTGAGINNNTKAECAFGYKYWEVKGFADEGIADALKLNLPLTSVVESQLDTTDTRNIPLLFEPAETSTSAYIQLLNFGGKLPSGLSYNILYNNSTDALSSAYPSNYILSSAFYPESKQINRNDYYLSGFLNENGTPVVMASAQFKAGLLNNDVQEQITNKSKLYTGYIFSEDLQVTREIQHNYIKFIDIDNNIWPASSIYFKEDFLPVVSSNLVHIGPIIPIEPNTRVSFERSKDDKNWSFSNKNYTQFAMTGLVKADGQLRSLSNYDYRTDNSENYQYYKIFYNCSGLITPPKIYEFDNRIVN